eukprot:9968464-Karenia_brevis.AAC.1
MCSYNCADAAGFPAGLAIGGDCWAETDRLMMAKYNEKGARSSSELRSKSAEPRRKRSVSRNISAELDS